MTQSGESINGFKKAIWSGVTTYELARAMHHCIQNDITGLYHLTNNTSINKYELLMLFKKYTNKDIDIIAIEGKDIDKSFVDTRGELDYVVPSYDEMVKKMVKNILNNNLYLHYQ